MEAIEASDIARKPRARHLQRIACVQFNIGSLFLASPADELDEWQDGISGAAMGLCFISVVLLPMKATKPAKSDHPK